MANDTTLDDKKLTFAIDVDRLKVCVVCAQGELANKTVRWRRRHDEGDIPYRQCKHCGQWFLKMGLYNVWSYMRARGHRPDHTEIPLRKF